MQNHIPKEKRAKQTCSFCKNHDISANKKGHKPKCTFKSCNCSACCNTRERQKFSALEKKNNYSETKKLKLNDKVFNRQRKVQKCKKCLNHGFNNSMREHKKMCAYYDCMCLKCRSTVKRRQFVRTEAKNKRNKQKNKSFNTTTYNLNMKSEGDDEQMNIPTTSNENKNYEYDTTYDDICDFSTSNFNNFDKSDSPLSILSFDSGFGCSSPLSLNDNYDEINESAVEKIITETNSFLFLPNLNNILSKL